MVLLSFISQQKAKLPLFDNTLCFFLMFYIISPSPGIVSILEVPQN